VWGLPSGYGDEAGRLRRWDVPRWVG
jgi:hypothetical protein